MMLVAALVVCWMSIVNHVSAAVDPTTVQQYFIIRKIDPTECTLSYDDRGGHSPIDLTTWNCENSLTKGQPFNQFGSYACGYGGSRDIELLRRCMNDYPAYFAFPAFNIPNIDPVGIPATDYYKIWIDQHSKASKYGSVWGGQKSWSYESVGDYWIGTGDSQTGWNTPPPANSTWLVHTDCLIPCKTAIPWYVPPKVWSNKGDGQSDQDLTVYYSGQNVNVQGKDYYYFYGASLSQTNFDTPNPQMCIKPECIREEQVKGMYQGPTVFDWNAVSPKLVTMLGDHEEINNDSGGTIVRSLTLQAAVTETATLQLTTSFGFSNTFEVSDSLKLAMDFEVVKAEETLSFKNSFTFNTNTAASSTQTQSVTKTLTNTFQVTVPAYTGLDCSYILQQATDVTVPFEQTMYYTAISYSAHPPSPLTSRQSIGDLLAATGFDGELGDYFPANKSVSGTVKGALKMSTVVQTSVNCTCIPLDTRPCPSALTVSPSGAAITGLRGSRKLRIKGRRATHVFDSTPAKKTGSIDWPIRRAPGPNNNNTDTDNAPDYRTKPAPVGAMYYHITNDLLRKISETKHSTRPQTKKRT